MNDLRIPIGSFFALVGLILIAVGLAEDYQAPLESANVNLYCGVSMLIFGAVMLGLARQKVNQSSRCTVAGSNAARQTAMYSAPSGPGVL